MRCMFCGGRGCKHENWKRNKNPAIVGLHSDWIDDNIIASQRLSSRLIAEYDVLGDMKSKGVTTIINVQLPGEHPWCGDKLAGNGGFSYLPEEIYNAGMFFFNPGWPDMSAPSIEHLINVV